MKPSGLVRSAGLCVPAALNWRMRAVEREFEELLTVQFEREGHHAECDVWTTRRWCICKGLPRDVRDQGYVHICFRGDGCEKRVRGGA